MRSKFCEDSVVGTENAARCLRIQKNVESIVATLYSFYSAIPWIIMLRVSIFCPPPFVDLLPTTLSQPVNEDHLLTLVISIVQNTTTCAD